MTTQNDCKRSRNPMEMLSDVTCQIFRPFFVRWGLFGHFWQLLASFCPKLKIIINWPCDHKKRSQEKQKSDGYGFRWHFYVSNILSFGPNFAKNGPKGPKKTWMSKIWNFTKLGVKICDTRPKPAYGRQGLDWIVGPGNSFVVFSTWNHETTLKTM